MTTMPLAAAPPLPQEVERYVSNSYPPNHNYRVSNGKLKPSCKLAVRIKKLKPLYPQPLESLLDLSSCKGYFVISAAMQRTCRRALGVDIFDRDLEASKAVQRHVGADQAQFQALQLHRLAERIHDFGGPFQTALLVNTYQYLYFGSSRSPDCYSDHDRIFHLVREVCYGRVIFSNRVRFDQVQQYCQGVGKEKGLAEDYCPDRILHAASRYFHVTDRGRIGRYPIWALDAR